MELIWRLTSSLIKDVIKPDALLFFMFQIASSLASIDLVILLSSSHMPSQQTLKIKVCLILLDYSIQLSLPVNTNPIMLTSEWIFNKTSMSQNFQSFSYLCPKISYTNPIFISKYKNFHSLKTIQAVAIEILDPTKKISLKIDK